MAPKYSKLVSLSAAALLVFVAVPACSKEEKAQKAEKAGPTSAAGTPSVQATGETAATPADEPETVVFEVTGPGSALTIDLVPSAVGPRAAVQRAAAVPEHHHHHP